MTEMLRNDDGATRLREMRPPSRRRRDQHESLRFSGTDASSRPELYDLAEEDDHHDIEIDFWGGTAEWVRREHDDVAADPEAETEPAGITRPVFDGTNDIDPYDSLDDIDQTLTWTERLGIDQIDPLITRTSVIILAALVAVPFAWTNRDDTTTSTPAATVVFENTVEPTDEAASPTVGADTTEAPAVTTSPAVIAATVSNVVTTAETPSAQSRAAGTRSQVVSAPTTTVPPCGSIYVVRPGDSWSLVADRASIRMGELLATNSASTDSMLYPDDEICLPPGATVVIPTTVPTRPSSGTTQQAPPTTTTTIVLPPEPTTSEAEAIIRDVWPDDLEDRALQIAHRESRFHANASNWCCVGLFQIHWNAHKGWLSEIGVTSKSQLFDARTNAQAAYALFQRNGWTPWDL